MKTKFHYAAERKDKRYPRDTGILEYRVCDRRLRLVLNQKRTKDKEREKFNSIYEDIKKLLIKHGFKENLVPLPEVVEDGTHN